jgi:hypothetical protein
MDVSLIVRAILGPRTVNSRKRSSVTAVWHGYGCSCVATPRKAHLLCSTVQYPLCPPGVSSVCVASQTPIKPAKSRQQKDIAWNARVLSRAGKGGLESATGISDPNLRYPNRSLLLCTLYFTKGFYARLRNNMGKVCVSCYEETWTAKITESVSSWIAGRIKA